MGAMESLKRHYRIELMLTINAFFYVLVATLVVGIGFYESPMHRLIDLALAVDILGACAKGFLIGAGLLIAHEVSG